MTLRSDLRVSQIMFQYWICQCWEYYESPNVDSSGLVARTTDGRPDKRELM
jgi:hypothetical protein